jgi:hypothetical protein
MAEALGFLELEPSSAPSPPVRENAELEVKRLDAKWQESEDADYFTYLGLPKSASGSEVVQAFQLLTAEFDPLRFVGHPDPGLQLKAQRLHALLEEAVQALSNDRLRTSYAQHLSE